LEVGATGTEQNQGFCLVESLAVTGTGQGAAHHMVICRSVSHTRRLRATCAPGP
jgi:hypothetical protein